MEMSTMLRITEGVLDCQRKMPDRSLLSNDISYTIIFDLLDQQDIVELLLEKYTLDELIERAEQD